MAVIISKELLPINPAYNDSIIQFSSDTLTGATRAEIVIGGRTYDVIPFNGVFTFNFREIVETLINTNKYEDPVNPNLLSGYLYSDANIKRNINVTIRVIGPSGNDVLSKTYTFLRSVEQLPDYNRLAALGTTTRVLLPTKNYVDFYMPMFEGYPVDFSIIVPIFGTYQFKNITTGQVTPLYGNLTGSVRRIFLSDGANSTTETEALILSSTLNKLELWVNGSFKANIYIMKRESDCGPYIKYINRWGSYSYWKFDSVYKGTITSKTIDDFTGKYDNLQNVTATSHIIGKTAVQTLQVTTTYSADDATYLQDLTTSPQVWMYTSDKPFVQQQPYSFYGVMVNDTPFEYINTKVNKGKANFTITMPDFFTQTN